jgi:SP family facilitated glucose transporter-like MFS transporter 3
MASGRGSQGFTRYGWVVCSWVLVTSFQYGYHISALNQIQAVLTCNYDNPHPLTSNPTFSLPRCIPMSDNTFSVVTAVFTVGGLLGSIAASKAIDIFGRKGACRISALFTTIGGGILFASGSVSGLVLGRLLVGVGSGIGICVSPLYLAEIAPTNIKGNVGVLTQLSIVFGIFGTQALGLRLAEPDTWRFVLLISAVLGLAQLFFSGAIIESPASLRGRAAVRAAEERLWKGSSIGDAEDPLLPENEDTEHEGVRPISVPQLFSAPELRKPLYIVCFSMLAQQVSGINAVLYYSNSILGKSLPKYAPYVSLGITIVNVIMTFPTVFLIERAGRKPLLVYSAAGILISLLAVGFGLDSGAVGLSSVAIVAFVMSFAFGLGPVPFVMIPEVSPVHAVSALSSVGLSLNWTANFIVGLVFLPLRNALAGGDPNKEGRVFFVFAAAVSLALGGLFRFYR